MEHIPPGSVRGVVTRMDEQLFGMWVALTGLTRERKHLPYDELVPGDLGLHLLDESTQAAIIAELEGRQWPRCALEFSPFQVKWDPEHQRFRWAAFDGMRLWEEFYRCAPNGFVEANP